MKRFINLLLVIMVAQSGTSVYGMRALQSARRVAAYLPAMRAMSAPVQSGLRLAHTQQSTAVKMVPHVARITAAHQKTLATFKVAQSKEHTSFFSGLFGKIAAGLASILGWLGFATNQKAQCEDKDSVPACNKENVFKYRNIYRKEFIAHACEHIIATDEQTVDAICYLIECYSEGAQELAPKALELIDRVNKRILRAILQYNPAVAQQMADAVIALHNMNNNELFVDILHHPNQWRYSDGCHTLAAKIAKNGIRFPVSVNNVVQQAAELPNISFVPIYEHGNPRTVSQSHFGLFTNAIFQLLRNFNNLHNPNVQRLFRNAYHKEQQETAKGNFVFYHGREYHWDFISEMYKQIYNLTANPAEQLGADKVVLRFDDSNTPLKPGLKGSSGITKPLAKDVLFLNISLFGNSESSGDSSAYWALSNSSVSQILGRSALNNFSTLRFFEQFNCTKYYDRHKKEFDYLEKLHGQANPTKTGNLLVVVAKDLRFIYPTNIFAEPAEIRFSGNQHADYQTAVETIVKTMRNQPKSLNRGKIDFLQFALDLSKPETRNPPANGLRIYSHTACDPEKRKVYEDYKDQLFAKIKAEMAADKQGIK